MKRSFGMPTAPLLAGWASPRVSSPAFPLVDPLENMSSQDAAELDRLMAAAETKIDRAPRGPPSPFDAPTGEDAQLRQRKSPPRDATAAATYDAVDVLRKYFGYNSFRPGQAEVRRDASTASLCAQVAYILQAIDEAIEMRDVCVFWSSGSGKSLCARSIYTIVDVCALINIAFWFRLFASGSMHEQDNAGGISIDFSNGGPMQYHQQHCFQRRRKTASVLSGLGSVGQLHRVKSTCRGVFDCVYNSGKARAFFAST